MQTFGFKAPVMAGKTAAVKPVVLRKAEKAVVAGITATATTLLLAASPAFADATVKLGDDSGGLAFVPKSVTIKAGETVTWINNKSFPHNVVFDPDSIPDGVDAGEISHEDYLNSPGQTVSTTFSVKGVYDYQCEPHSGLMAGKITVQ